MGTKTYEAENLVGDSAISIDFSLDSSGITVAQGRRQRMQYSWDEIAEIEVEGPDTVQKRVTVSRVLLTGIFAFALKKKTGESFLFVSFVNSQEPLILRFPKKSQPELHAIIAPHKHRVSRPNSGDRNISSDSEDISTKLESLSDLHSKKLITDEEYKKSREKLLGL